MIPMLSVIQSGPSIDRRYRRIVSYQASVAQRPTRRVPDHQSAKAPRGSKETARPVIVLSTLGREKRVGRGGGGLLAGVPCRRPVAAETRQYVAAPAGSRIACFLTPPGIDRVSANADSVTVIVVNHGGGLHVLRCLACLADQTLPPARILVIDNASTDGSAAACERAIAADVRLDGLAEVWRFATNLGFAAACNRGIHAADTPLVALLNPDKLAHITGHGLTAIVEITLDRQGEEHLSAFEQRMRVDAAVQQCYRTSPGPDFVLIVHVADMPAYLALSQRLFTGDANVRNVKAFFSIKRSKVQPKVLLRQ